MKRFLILAVVVGLICSVATAMRVAAQTSEAASLPFSSAIRAGDFVYVSGVIASNPDGSRPVGVTAQTERMLDMLDEAARRHGSSLANAASVYVYLKNRADFQAMNEAYRARWPEAPPARVTLQAELARPDALAEIAMVAIPDGRERQVIIPDGWSASRTLSPGIKSGNTLFLSGQVARTPDGTLMNASIGEETRTILSNARQILEAADMSLGDVAAVRVFIDDLGSFQEMNDGYREFFQDAPPARATAIAPTMSDHYSVEISMIAVKDPNRRVVQLPRRGNSTTPPLFSSAIEAGGRLFLSGAMGVTDANERDPEAQTRQTMTRLGNTLDAAGYGWSDVVEGIVYISDMEHYGGMNRAYRATFADGVYPTRATIEAGLVSTRGLVEIMMTAVKGRETP